MTPKYQTVGIDIGNTRIAIGTQGTPNVFDNVHVLNSDIKEAIKAIRDAYEHLNPELMRPILISSVNENIANQVISKITKEIKNAEIFEIEKDLPVPIQRDLDPETITGSDRLLSALGAWVTLEQACIVISAGTAVTIDFIDGEGTFHGGVIAPGTRIQLKSLFQDTHALPEIKYEIPNQTVFGKSTKESMLQGIHYGLIGLVQKTTENFSEIYGAYPMLIATGGDANSLFGNEEIIDRIVPDLTLIGIGHTAEKILFANEENK